MSRLPYQIWENLARNYSISQTYAGLLWEHLRKDPRNPNVVLTERQFRLCMQEAALYRRIWIMLGARERTLEDWHEKMKERRECRD